MPDNVFNLTDREFYKQEDTGSPAYENRREKFRKYRKQRLERGWADCDTWDMDGWLLKTIPDMLTFMAKSDTYPESLEADGQRRKVTARKYRHWLQRTAGRIRQYGKMRRAVWDGKDDYTPERKTAIQAELVQAFCEIAQNIDCLWT